jgi:hypothetical protein
MAMNILAIVVLGLMALLVLGFLVVAGLCVGGFLSALIGLGKGRRRPSAYHRQLLAAERGRGRRRRRRGTKGHGITIQVDLHDPKHHGP